MTNPTKEHSEKVIRDYLGAVKDPLSLLDHEKIMRLEEALAGENDPVNRLKIVSELERTKAPRMQEVVDEFILVAKGWAEVHDVTAEAFLAEGAEVDVLREAGIHVDGKEAPKAASKPKAAPKSESNGNNGDPDKVVKVVRHINRTKKPFTTSQVMKATKVSRHTATKAISQLLEEGALKEAGEASSGRGRHAKTYERVQ